MKAAIQVNSAIHQKEHAGAIEQAFDRCGISWSEFRRDQVPLNLKQYDLVVMWGVKPVSTVREIKRLGIPLLVMERGYLPDRFVFSSMGWNGLNNRAKFPTCEDQGERLNTHWPDILRPWKTEGEYVLLCGQVPGDASVYGLNLDKWASDVTQRLQEKGETVVFRPHPLVARTNKVLCPNGAMLSVPGFSLEQDLEKAKYCVTYNSNAGVEAVYFGVPTYTLDEGAMAWPVASHSLDEQPITPDRTAWANQLAWCNWRIEEIADGSAWAYIRKVMWST